MKSNVKTYRDKSGQFLKPIKKLESFGHIFIVFKYLDSRSFRVIRKDRINKNLQIVSS